MKYEIYCDNYLLYDSTNNNYQVGEPKLTQELNKVDDLNFNIYPNHVYFEKIQKLKSVITLFKDDEMIFKGRALNDDTDFNNIKNITCEGSLGYLFDSLIRPFDFPNDSQFEGYVEATNVIEYFLNWILTCHNNQVQDSQKILLGNVTVTDPNNYIAYSSIEYLTPYEIIKTRLLDTHGGYLSLRYTSSGTYLDYLEDFTNTGYSTGSKLTCTQIVEFGSNLLDVKKEVKGEDLKTGIIPLGARIKDSDGNQTDKYLTIEDLPDKEIASGYVKSGDHIINTALAEQYGKIFEVVKWDDVNGSSNLQTKALNYLADSIKYKISIEVKALDLRLTDEQIGSFKIGQYIRCKSTPHNLSDLYLLNKLTLDIKNPQNTTITVGESFLSLTDIQNQGTVNTDDLIERVGRIERGYTLNGAITDIIDEKIENSSVIEQTSENIMSNVSQMYTAKTEFTEYQNQISTQFTQTSQQFEMQFTNIEELINTVNTNSSSNYNEIIKYIRFIDGNIVLGQVDNQLTLQISNDRISFMQNGLEVAYINNNKLYITDGEFLHSLILGNFAFYPRTSGNLSFNKIT